MEISDHDKTERPTSQEPEKRIPEHQSRTVGGSQTDSRSHGYDSQRSDRGYRGWQNTEDSIRYFVGGILKQSRTQLEERLQEYEDCLEWYKNVKQKVLKQIDELDQLQEQLNNTLSDTEEE